jgi:dihydrofolate reductase
MMPHRRSPFTDEIRAPAQSEPGKTEREHEGVGAMGTLTIATFMTLDGIMQAPGGPDEDRDGGFEHGGWSFPYFSEDMGEAIGETFSRADCFLLGRRTYEIFAASWPNFPDQDDPVASKLNTLPKYVVSTTLNEPDWQPTTVISGDVGKEVNELKEQYDGEIQVHGSATLAQTLHAEGLIDEYRVFIEPVVLGTGKRLFEPAAAPTALRLVECRPMAKGAICVVYQPIGKPTYGEFQMEEGYGLPE